MEKGAHKYIDINISKFNKFVYNKGGIKSGIKYAMNVQD